MMNQQDYVQLILKNAPYSTEDNTPWCLSQCDIKRLESIAPAPDGGWASFFGLVAGLYFDATHSGFELLDQPTRRPLIEAFTCYLTPPSSAAIWLMMFGMHPHMSVNILRQVHRQTNRCTSTQIVGSWSQQEVTMAHDLCFGALATLIGFIRAALGAVTVMMMVDWFEHIRSEAQQGIKSHSMWRHLNGEFSYSMRALINEVFVPAGVLRPMVYEDFYEHVPGSLDGIRVGPHEPKDQDAFTRMSAMMALG